MNTPNAGAGRRPRGFAREIVAVLLTKLVLIIAIKFAFFSEPMDKREVVKRLGEMVASPTGQQTPGGQRPQHVEQK